MNKRFASLVGGLGMAALLLVACGGSTPTPAPTAKPAAPAGNPDKGKEKFAGTCTSCHGLDAKGMPGLGKDLHSNQFLAGLSDAQAVAFLKTGRTASDPLNTTKVDMPPKGGNPVLNDADLADIVAYLRTLK